MELGTKLNIGKKKQPAVSIQSQSKGIKKKRHCKKSQKIVKF